MLYGSETWPDKVDRMISLEINYARMVQWMCNVKPEDMIAAVEHRNRMQMNNKGVGDLGE